jgi:hypothetical protein
MSRNIIFMLMYHGHKLTDLILNIHIFINQFFTPLKTLSVSIIYRIKIFMSENAR